MTVSLLGFAILATLSTLFVTYSFVYFSSFTWTDSSDLYPCQMSYYHTDHIPIPIYNSINIKSPTYQLRIDAGTVTSGGRIDRRKTTSDSILQSLNMSINEAISSCHNVGYRLLRYFELREHLSSPSIGTPILFLHGSSGNYHQARSIASRINIINKQTVRYRIE